MIIYHQPANTLCSPFTADADLSSVENSFSIVLIDYEVPDSIEVCSKNSQQALFGVIEN